MPGESQRRYEQAAELAADDLAAADALRSAAGAAESRHFGDDALRLRQRAADAALRAGDRAGGRRRPGPERRADQSRPWADGDRAPGRPAPRH